MPVCTTIRSDVGTRFLPFSDLLLALQEDLPRLVSKGFLFVNDLTSETAGENDPRWV